MFLFPPISLQLIFQTDVGYLIVISQSLAEEGTALLKQLRKVGCVKENSTPALEISTEM